MGIREEFEKAFDNWYWKERKPGESEWATALWAAKWMAERCAVALEEGYRDDLGYGEQTVNSEHWAIYVRQLAKELSDGK